MADELYRHFDLLTNIDLHSYTDISTMSTYTTASIRKTIDGLDNIFRMAVVHENLEAVFQKERKKLVRNMPGKYN